MKNHYIILYFLFYLFAILNSLATLNSGMYILLIVFSIAWTLLVTINHHYYRKTHTIRSVINCVSLVIFMILLTVQSVNVSNPQQNSIPAISGLVFLFITITINIITFIRILYKRSRSKRF